MAGAAVGRPRERARGSSLRTIHARTRPALPRGHVVLDYPSLIVKAAPVFENCARSLNDQLNGEPNLRLLMEFFLAMKRADIPQVDEKLHEWTGGYLLPTEVL